MIRDKLFREITKQLDSHPRFENSDFYVQSLQNQSKSETSVSISFIPEPKYSLLFKIPNEVTTPKEAYQDSYYSIKGTVRPGPLAYDEQFTTKGETGILGKIKEWLTSIWEELSSNPIVKQIESQEKELHELYEKFEEIEESQFTREEANKLKSKLDEVEEMLKQQMVEHSKDKAKLQKDMEKLHTDIETLKETINSYNKKGWVKSFASKIFKWTKDSDNRKMLADGYKLVKEFLPEHIKGVLPEHHS